MIWDHSSLSCLAGYETCRDFSRELNRYKLPIRATEQSRWAKAPHYSADQAAKAYLVGQLRALGLPMPRVAQILSRLADVTLMVGIDALYAGEISACLIAIPADGEPAIVTQPLGIFELIDRLGPNLVIVDLGDFL